MTRCVSTCQKKSLDNCKSNSKCIYVNGKTRKYCRLSYKYKMNKLFGTAKPKPTINLIDLLNQNEGREESLEKKN